MLTAPVFLLMCCLMCGVIFCGFVVDVLFDLIPQDGVKTDLEDISKRPSKKRYDMQLRLAEFVKNGHQFKGGFYDVALNK